MLESMVCKQGILNTTYTFSLFILAVPHLPDDDKASTAVHYTWLQLHLPKVTDNLLLYDLAKLIGSHPTKLVIEELNALQNNLSPVESAEPHHPPDPFHRRTWSIVNLSGGFARWRSA